jgi:hypothetical protein
LSLLTGITPSVVERQLPARQTDWSDAAILAFLKRRHFRVATLSKYGVTDLAPKTPDWERCPVTSNHVLLCNLLMCRNEASWLVITQNEAFHNFDRTPLSPLTFVNKPPQSIYLVMHKAWK